MAKHLYIQGLVQGVGYRASFAALANSLSLSGWVRNRRNGAVEAMVDGTDDALERLITWARQGPPTARVENITISDNNESTGIKSGRVDILPTI